MFARRAMRGLPYDSRRCFLAFGFDRQFQDFAALLLPRMHQPGRQPENHDVEETADDKPEHRRERDGRARIQKQFDHRKADRLSNDGGEFEDRQIHANHHTAHNATDDDHNERFEKT